MTKNEMFVAIFDTIVRDFRTSTIGQDNAGMIGVAPGYSVWSYCADKTKELVNEHYVSEDDK